MGRSLRIGTAFGIGLYVHWSFLIIPFLAVVSGAGDGLGGVLLSTGFALGVFGCVLLHELGHALMARSFGIGTRDITLFPIGGVARLERMSEHPGEEIAIAVAGPLVNVVIVAGLWFGLALAGLSPAASANIQTHGPLLDRLLILLLSANIMLVLFNLIPAFPMDGGRVFRALLALGLGRLRGTEIAVAVSKVLAVIFIAAGILGVVPIIGVHVSPFLAVIGLFIMVAGNQELAMLRYQEYRRRSPMTIDNVPTVLPADGAVEPLRPSRPDFSGFLWDPRAGAWIEWRDGRAVGATYVNRPASQW
jgi:Zn-dependent protease